MHMLDPLEPRRLLYAGDVDTTFGVNGSVALSDESFITAAGNNTFFIPLTSGLEKIDANAAPVTSFGSNGAVTLPFAPNILLLKSGKILVEGVQSGDAFVGKIERLNADGSLDTSFGDAGSVDLPSVLNQQLVESVLEQSDGKIVVLTQGFENSAERFFRLNSDGSVDSTFHTIDVSPFGDVWAFDGQSDDKILIAGNLPSAGIVRFNADGTRDLSFGTGGKVDNGGQPNVLALIPGSDGFLTSANALLRKYSADGVLDTTFGDGGSAISGIDESFASNFSSRLIPAPGGKWLFLNLGGMTRLNADGTRDESFGRLTRSKRHFSDAAFDSNGDILLSVANDDGEDAALLRLQGSANGTPGPFVLIGSTLKVTGTNGDNSIVVFDDMSNTVGAGMNDVFGRLFNATDVALVSVVAGAGNDQVTTQFDFDKPVTVLGGAGDDTLIGGGADDSLTGNAGRDLLIGNAGNDRLAGNGGSDKLYGGIGDDILYGGKGDDWLRGQSGNDILLGGDGHDRIYGGVGVDTYAGGNGNDLIVSTDDVAESIFGDSGTDSVIGDASDILSSIENASGG
jgi:uncharacterized delta-60 repeat protein